jgi:hypothetical protein
MCKIAFAIAVVVLVAGLATRNRLILQLASVPFVVAVGLLWAAVQRMPRARIIGDTVRLTHVHPQFVQALENPPGKCGGCTNNGSCSVSQSHACENASTDTGPETATENQHQATSRATAGAPAGSTTAK